MDDFYISPVLKHILLFYIRIFVKTFRPPGDVINFTKRVDGQRV